LDNAEEKLIHLLNNPRKRLGALSDWTNSTIDRCLDIMFTEEGKAKWWRNDRDYRNNVTESKY
jgi:hypothetical protein